MFKKSRDRALSRAGTKLAGGSRAIHEHAVDMAAAAMDRWATKQKTHPETIRTVEDLANYVGLAEPGSPEIMMEIGDLSRVQVAQEVQARLRASGYTHHAVLRGSYPERYRVSIDEIVRVNPDGTEEAVQV